MNKEWRRGCFFVINLFTYEMAIIGALNSQTFEIVLGSLSKTASPFSSVAVFLRSYETRANSKKKQVSVLKRCDYFSTVPLTINT